LISTKEKYGGWKQQNKITRLIGGPEYEADRHLINMRPCRSIADVKVFHLAHRILQSSANKAAHTFLGAEMRPGALLK